MLAHIEAFIDFEADETNQVGNVMEPLRLECQELIGRLEKYLHNAKSGETIREGKKVMIAGPPNAGKSTLLNLLADRRVAITSPIAGTTRDVISTEVMLAGQQLVIKDTAGLHETTDIVEQEGIALAKS